MRKPGVFNILLGAGVFVLGAVIAAITYFRAEAESNYLLAWVPMAFGIGAFIVGLVQFGKAKSPKEEQAARYAKIEIRAIAVSMIHQALSDHELSDEEVGVIKELFRQYTGIELEDESLERLVREAKAGRSDYLEEMQNAADSLSDQAKEMIVKMSYVVLLADHAVRDEEIRAILETAETVGIRQKHALRMIQDVRGALESQGNNEPEVPDPK